jgi:hypothetical protein
MPIVLERFIESITINKQFAESLAIELRSNNLTSGTILLVANEILLDPSYVLNYSSTNNTDEPGTPGESGNPGGNAGEGGIGFDGMNIKVFCGELVNSEIISNGGAGGTGGKGGRGGNGGRNTNHGTQGAGGQGGIAGTGGRGGRGGRGGNGGNGGAIATTFNRGGNGGKIKTSLFNDPIGTFNTISSGGGRGSRGEPGISATGVRGPEGLDENLGISSTPDVKRLKFKELWEKIIIELKIPSG